MHLTPKFHHPRFNRSEVIVRSKKQTDRQTNKLTNKQTPLKTSSSLRYATPVGNKDVCDTPRMVSVPKTDSIPSAVSNRYSIALRIRAAYASGGIKEIRYTWCCKV